MTTWELRETGEQLISGISTCVIRVIYKKKRTQRPVRVHNNTSEAVEGKEKERRGQEVMLEKCPQRHRKEGGISYCSWIGPSWNAARSCATEKAEQNCIAVNSLKHNPIFSVQSVGVRCLNEIKAEWVIGYRRVPLPFHGPPSTKRFMFDSHNRISTVGCSGFVWSLTCFVPVTYILCVLYLVPCKIKGHAITQNGIYLL